MSLILTNPTVILAFSIILVIGFVFFGIFTLRAYSSNKSRLVLFISMAYFTLAVTNLLVLLVIPQHAMLGIEEEYLEAMVEGIQLLAALLFYLGLKKIKPHKVEAVQS